jgi:hypothetical protein
MASSEALEVPLKQEEAPLLCCWGMLLGLGAFVQLVKPKFCCAPAPFDQFLVIAFLLLFLLFLDTRLQSRYRPPPPRRYHRYRKHQSDRATDTTPIKLQQHRLDAYISPHIHIPLTPHVQKYCACDCYLVPCLPV